MELSIVHWIHTLGDDKLIHTDRILGVEKHFLLNRWKIQLIRRNHRGNVVEETLCEYKDEQQAIEALERIRVQLRNADCLIDLTCPVD